MKTKNNKVSTMKQRILKKREKCRTIGKASDYIFDLDDYAQKYPSRKKAVLYIRESSDDQNYNGNHEIHERPLREELNRRGIDVIDCIHDVYSGWYFTPTVSPLLCATVQLAKDNNADIYSTSVDRFIRSRKFHRQENPFVTPTVWEYEHLMKVAGDVKLITLLDPDTDPKVVRGFQSMWGKRIKGKPGGRPKKAKPGDKKKIRENNKSRALKLYNKGYSVYRIEKKLGIPKSTIFDWIKAAKKEGII